ncbi:MAG: Gfo/Idh/MocA family oxidoreductase [Verrucomicrobia bacterium]|nr:Gfo/Idh/MocA family oxidoreductase [Verrucomicrobiota bacterium]
MDDYSMKRLGIGVLGCSEFAARAMIPGMKEVPEIELRAVASREAAKAKSYAGRFGCDAIEGYDRLLKREDIDAVYVPLPPGLHEEWVSRSLDAGKHVLVEKPFTLDEATATRLIGKARERRLLVVENMLFPHHSQFAWVREQLKSGLVGTLRLCRSTFTIPPLKPGNFRYDADLGGGALLDLGPYVVRFATAFLGEKLTLRSAVVCMDSTRHVELTVSAEFSNADGLAAQVACGFDTHYQCNWEFLGTKAKLVVERGYTPPPGFTPTVRIERQNQREKMILPADNHYRNMWRSFARVVLGGEPFEPHWLELERQAKYLDQIRIEAARV